MKISLGFWAVVFAAVFTASAFGRDASAEAVIRRKVDQVRADQRKLATAIESYFVDYNAYPAWTTDPAFLLRPPSQADAIAAHLKGPIPSFRAPGVQPRIATVTTPIAYIAFLPADPFVEQPNLTFGYYAPPNGWIVWSAGPDGIFDLDWTVYDPAKPQPQPEILARYTYDPTNGVVSPGDIWRVKQ
jgi:hypothetical protein